MSFYCFSVCAYPQPEWASPRSESWKHTAQLTFPLNVGNHQYTKRGWWDAGRLGPFELSHCHRQRLLWVLLRNTELCWGQKSLSVHWTFLHVSAGDWQEPVRALQRAARSLLLEVGSAGVCLAPCAPWRSAPPWSFSAPSPSCLTPAWWDRKPQRQTRFSPVLPQRSWFQNLSCTNAHSRVCSSPTLSLLLVFELEWNPKVTWSFRRKLLNFTDGWVKISKFSPDPSSNADSPGLKAWWFQQGQLAVGSLNRISNLGNVCLFPALLLLRPLLNNQMEVLALGRGHRYNLIASLRQCHSQNSPQ